MSTVNHHVEMLNAFQPFDADFAEIYFESSEATIRLHTKASQTLAKWVSDPGVQLVVLTGDAGHGKTYLCAELLASAAGLTTEESRKKLNAGGRADRDLATLGGRQLRIVKDLSEIPGDEVQPVLHEAISARGRVTIICANEGRLRANVQSDLSLHPFLKLLDDSISRGRTHTEDGSIAMLNLNHQSITAGTLETSLLGQALQAWVIDNLPWEGCSGCPAIKTCPIKKNRDLLAADDERGLSRRAVLQDLLTAVERTGRIVTVRELLIFVAHLATGGLRCRDVHQRIREAPTGWQWQFMFHQVCFGLEVPVELIDGLDVFDGLRLLDPATRALRRVDDRLDIPTGNDPFAPPVPPELFEAPRASKAAKQQADAHRTLWRRMRRADLFNARMDDSVASTWHRIGLRHADKFEQVMSQGLEMGLKKKVHAGLEAIQGLRPDSWAKLRLAEPAFTSSRTADPGRAIGSPTTVLAGSVPMGQIRVKTETLVYEARRRRDEVGVEEAVDWIDRYLMLSFSGDEFKYEHTLRLTVQDFEFLLSFGEGLRAWMFHEPEVRRFQRRLALIADEVVNEEDDEPVLLVSTTGGYVLSVDGDRLYGGPA